MLKKAISHIHTSHSYDCCASAKKIVDKAVAMHIDYLVITDHDSLAGSLEAAAYAQQRNYPITIPIGAEFTTDIGDVIITHITSPNFPFEKNHQNLCRAARGQGAISILPHPFKGHKLQEINFDLIDCIEIFNSRCTVQENIQAIALAQQLKKPVVYGADAHTLADLGNAIFAYEGVSPFEGKTFPLRLLSTPWHHNEFSRFLRGVKLRKTKEALRAIKNSVLTFCRRGLGRYNEF